MGVARFRGAEADRDRYAAYLHPFFYNRSSGLNRDNPDLPAMSKDRLKWTSDMGHGIDHRIEINFAMEFLPIL